jgi:hypothetical protein
VIEQGPQSQNSNIIGYGLEGLTNPTPHEVYAINNTIVNNRSNGSFFQFAGTTALFKAYNNIIAGNGSMVAGTWPTAVDTSSNLVSTTITSFNFRNSSIYDYQPTDSSLEIINKGGNPGIANNISLIPEMVYVHPNNAAQRCNSGVSDIGAFEFCAPVAIVQPPIGPLTIYPNPAQNRFIVELRILGKGANHMQVFDVTGLKIYSADLADNVTQFEISALWAKGIYYIQIQDSEGQTRAFKKLLIQ